MLTKATARVQAFQQPPSSGDPNESLRQQRDALLVLTQLPVRDAIGAACSYLLYAAMNHQVELRRVLNEKVVKVGFVGESLLQVIQRASR